MKTYTIRVPATVHLEVEAENISDATAQVVEIAKDLGTESLIDGVTVLPEIHQRNGRIILARNCWLHAQATPND